MTIILFCTHLFIIGFIGFRWWRKETVLKLFFWPALLLKIGAGVALGLLYTYYYTAGDTFHFFHDGVQLATLARDDFFQYLKFLWAGDDTFAIWPHLFYQQPRSVFLSKIISLVNLITFDNYWLTALYFSTVSFFCSWYLVKTIVYFFPELKIAAVVAFLFFPSVVFWSAGIIKESLAAASLFFLSAVFLRTWFRKKIGVNGVLLSALAVWVLWSLKYYFAAVAIPVMLTSYIVRFVLVPLVRQRRKGIELVLWFCCFALLLFSVSHVHPNFYPERFLQVLVTNSEAFIEISAPEDLIQFYKLKADVGSVLINSPWAFVSGLFRPFVWESGNILQFAIALENLVVLTLFISALSQVPKLFKHEHRLLLVSLLVYITLLCILITLSTPNFGTLSRYRVGYFPYFILLVMVNNSFFIGFKHFIERSWRNLVR